MKPHLLLFFFMFSLLSVAQKKHIITNLEKERGKRRQHTIRSFPKQRITFGKWSSFICREHQNSLGMQKIKALKSEDHDLEKEALRIVNLMPDWTPGTYNGKKVSVPFTSPINFKLR